MKTAEIKARIKNIEIHREDDECAHGLEDGLYQRFIRSIADGDVGGIVARRQAQLVLTTEKIDFGRWTA